MPKRRSIGVIAVLCVCLCCFYLLNTGFQHVLPSSILRFAGQRWEDGQYAESIRWFAGANASAFNAGWRWTIAGFYLRRMKDLIEDEKLVEALENCSQAVIVLDGHDDEGGVRYECVMIEEKIRTQK